MKDYKETIESVAVAWAVMVIFPLDIIDFPIILFLKELFGISYVQMAVMYHLLAVITLIILAPAKLKKGYYKLKKYF